MSSAKKDTSGVEYTDRLQSLEHKKWKEILDVQRPYRKNIHRLQPGKTLDVGCGIGRHLRHLPQGSVGVDHNKHSIESVNKSGMIGFTGNQFHTSKYAKKNFFDSMLLAHVIEHMTEPEAKKIIAEYLPYIKKGGKVIVICPQKKGFASDKTHVTYFDAQKIGKLLEELKLTVTKQQSFPFPQKVGDIFTYNEFVVVGRK